MRCARRSEAVRCCDDTRDFRFEAEAKYSALVEQIPGVVYLDPVNESLDSIFVSPQVRELLGIEPEDWIADQSAGPSTCIPTTSCAYGTTT